MFRTFKILQSFAITAEVNCSEKNKPSVFKKHTS